MKFIRISRRVQLLSLGVVSAALTGWAGVTLAMAANSVSLAHERAALAAEGKSVATAASKVKDYRKSVDDLTQDLEARQDFMDDLYRTHFGAVGEAGGDNAAGADLVGPDTDAKKDSLNAKISMAPEAEPLLRLQERPAAAIRSFGLDPDSLARSAARAQGGPFVPWKGEKTAMTDELEHLADALARMEFLERSLLAIPSGKPTAAPMETSSYGFRRDPFNGHAAFHAGIDFPGSYGQSIQAAAAGRVSFVGQRSGYGNVIEVEHGNGLMTRYAHLSGYSSRVGQKVARGAQIGRMGSTGRSTGTHLHFEVRLNGQPINPRRFLEARQDVLQVQQIAKARFADVGNRG